ncbi:hypothetical protein MESS2_870023 [Mesorhizobium metallidurans STM 2683]|uniref:Uncharacterized protein n=1 Tax=Mesorhizobium metallidurans STM 2683 TaxID=1297569 RepID=M5EYY0_9HYPH|nr:hypothetical protein MESS2_870023 [Mesorhizobium metallidurans STM 2683]
MPFVLPAPFFRRKTGPRLNVALRGIDGSLAGPSHREIVKVLIVSRVHADWADPGDHLSDRIRGVSPAVRSGMRTIVSSLPENVTVPAVRQPPNSSL